MKDIELTQEEIQALGVLATCFAIQHREDVAGGLMLMGAGHVLGKGEGKLVALAHKLKEATERAIEQTPRMGKIIDSWSR